MVNDVLFGWLYKTPMTETHLDKFVESCWIFLFFLILYLIYRHGDK